MNMLDFSEAALAAACLWAWAIMLAVPIDAWESFPRMSGEAARTAAPMSNAPGLAGGGAGTGVGSGRSTARAIVSWKYVVRDAKAD